MTEDEKLEYERFMSTPPPPAGWPLALCAAVRGLFTALGYALACGVALMVPVLVVAGVVIGLSTFFAGSSPTLVHGAVLFAGIAVIVIGAGLHTFGGRPSRRLYRASDDIDG